MCWIGGKLIALQPLKKKKKKSLQLQNKCKKWLPDPENMGKDTKTDFLSQILRTLWGIEYLAHLQLFRRPFYFLHI